ncbi:MAG: ABC transporter substrate-binding protein [Planctomycetota bacterium]
MRSIPPRALRRCTLALALGLLALACADRGSTPAPAVPAARDVVMPDGRHVSVRSRGLHIFAASSSVVDFVVALAPPERVAALPEQALDYSALPADNPAWQRVPRFSTFVAEEVIARSPDLVIAEPWQDKDTAARLKSAGIEVVVLPEVRTWKDARATLLSVGQLLELEDRAREVVRDLDARVAVLAAHPGARAGLRALCYSNFGSGWSAGIHTTIHEQIVLAGMRNAMAERGADGHVQVSFEDLIALDPDLILVSMPLHQGEGTQGDRGGASQRLLETEPSLRELRAVQQKRIVALPPSLFATGSQSIVSGAEALAAAVDAMLAREAAPAEKRE